MHVIRPTAHRSTKLTRFPHELGVSKHGSIRHVQQRFTKKKMFVPRLKN